MRLAVARCLLACWLPLCDAGLADVMRWILYRGRDPYRAVAEMPDPDAAESGHYLTNLRPDVVRLVMNLTAEGRTSSSALWVELGSFVGKSAILLAREAKAAGHRPVILCVDSFTGDTNMWVWQQSDRNLLMRDHDGHLRIYEQFLKNVLRAGHNDIIFPVQATSVVGMAFIQRSVTGGLLGRLPQVIYLDSAHEAGETLLEIRRAWQLLSPRGVLFGDDFDWPAVAADVATFAREAGLRFVAGSLLRRIRALSQENPVRQPVQGVISLGRHWLVYKHLAKSVSFRADGVYAVPMAPLPEGIRAWHWAT